MQEGDHTPGPTALQATGADAAQQAELWTLLSRQAARYTMGDSSSLPVETAQELLASIRFCVDLCRRRDPTADTETAFQRGRTLVGEQLRDAGLLLAAVQAAPPPVTNLAYRDTVRDLALFFRRYDSDYFAHDIPCMIDYPLSRPVEGLEGVSFIRAYAGRLRVENEFCRRFAAGDLAALLRACSPTWEEDLQNLYETPAHCALVLVLLGRDFRRLAVTEADRLELRRAFSAEPAAQPDLVAAANRLCDALDIRDPRARAYHRETAVSLTRRIRALAPPLPLELLLPSPAAGDGPAPAAALFRDGERMDDEALRRLVDSINGCRFAADKAAAVRRHVHSLGDLLEVLDTCFWEEESLHLFAAMGDAELAALGHALDERRREGPDRRAPSGWEERYTAHVAALEPRRRGRVEALRRALGSSAAPLL